MASWKVIVISTVVAVSVFLLIYVGQSSVRKVTWQKFRSPPFASLSVDLNISRTSPPKEFLSVNTTKPLRTDQPTSSLYSTFKVIPNQELFRVDDIIRIVITARDSQNNIKSYGGDYFRVKLFSDETQSSLGLDVTRYHGDGRYSADMRLRWPGKVQVLVRLVHPSEAILVLERIRSIQPGRVVYSGRFVTMATGKQITEDVTCVPNLIPNQSVCNFTDESTGYPWYCIRPSNAVIRCEDWKWYTTDHVLSQKYTMGALQEGEERYFLEHKQLLKSPSVFLNVEGRTEDWLKNLTAHYSSLPSCFPGQHLDNQLPSGFYHSNVWYSDQCRVRHFDANSFISCSRGRSIRIFGDSTARQFYIYLTATYKNLKGNKPIDDSQSILGPRKAADSENNIDLTFNFHGHPARPSHFIRRDPLQYVVNRLDDIDADNQTVILVSVGTHYTPYSLDMYEKRMRDIKAAVQRLHARSPGTLVVIKSANTRRHEQLLHILHNSEWYIKTIDLKMRDIFSDYPLVGFIDAWDLTVAQNFPDNVHPALPVLTSLVNMFLSYICP